jgi:nucleoside-diphosphate-sugar epimerase
MTILVTGGTGLVGSRLLRRFVDAGVDCRVLVRPGREVSAGASPVQGDLFDADSLKRAMEGVSAIVHLAAVFRTQNEDDIWCANRDGTKNLIAATKVQAPQVRFVMASTGLVYDADASRPVWKMTRPILSSRIPQVISPQRTNFAAADSTGVFSVSPSSTAMGTDIWPRYRRWSRGSSGTRRGLSASLTIEILHARSNLP